MAWPFSRYQTFVDYDGTNAGTRIVAAFLNAIQDAISGVIGGSKSVKRLTVDGVGDQAPPASSGGLTPAILVTEAIGANGFTLVAEFNDTLGDEHAQRRVYMTGSAFTGPASFFEVTNAYWDDGATKWTQDDPLASSSLIIKGRYATGGVDKDLAVFTQASGTSPWDTSGWTAGDVLCGTVETTGTITAGGVISTTGGANIVADGNLVSTAGHIAASDGTAGYLQLAGHKGSATPGAGQTVTVGQMYREQVAIAHCQCVTGAFAYGINVSAFAKTPATTGIYTVQLGSYTAHLTHIATIRGTTAGYCTTQDNGTGLITVRTFDATGTLSDAVDAFSLAVWAV